METTIAKLLGWNVRYIGMTIYGLHGLTATICTKGATTPLYVLSIDLLHKIGIIILGYFNS